MHRRSKREATRMMARRARAAPAVHGTVTIICVVGGVGVGVEEEAMACGGAAQGANGVITACWPWLRQKPGQKLASATEKGL